jgi:hypothetical protein
MDLLTVITPESISAWIGAPPRVYLSGGCILLVKIDSTRQGIPGLATFW